MKAAVTPLIIAALMAMHAYVADGHTLNGADSKRQLRTTDMADKLDSIVPDAMVLGSVRSKNRLIAVSTADDDAAVMTTNVKTTSRARDQEKESLFGGTAPTKGSSAVLTKNTMVARSDATTDKSTMTKTSGTLVRAEDPDIANEKEADTVDDEDHLTRV